MSHWALVLPYCQTLAKVLTSLQQFLTYALGLASRG